MSKVQEIHAATSAWRATTVLAAVFSILGLDPTVGAQDRTLVLMPNSVRQGQVTKVRTPACPGATVVSVDGKLFPARTTSDPSELEINTDSLEPGDHVVTAGCDKSASEPKRLIVSAKEVSIPTVICAWNRSPRDGIGNPLTTAAANAEAEKVAAAVKAAEAVKQQYPLAEETARLLTRCDKDWVWTVRLEDSLSVQVANLNEWFDVEKNNATILHLFVDGTELTNLALRRVDVDRASKAASLETILTFETGPLTTENQATSRKAWAQVLRTARAKSWNFETQSMILSVGPAGGPQWPTTARIEINPYPKGLTRFALTVVGLLVALLGVLAVRTPLLRDGGGGKSAPFSLAKNQMALWFLVIFSSFLFVTVTTGQAAAMSSTALILIGISGATGLIAVNMDKRKDSSDVDRRRALEAEKATLTQAIDGALPDGLKEKRRQVADGSTEAVRLDAEIQAKLQQLEVVTRTLQEKPQQAEPPKSQGWLTDILSDENGLSFHRLQMAAWTVAMVGAFVVAVWRTFAMAEFDGTTLGLLGISSGTYLGFKFPERQGSSETSNK